MLPHNVKTEGTPDVAPPPAEPTLNQPGIPETEYVPPATPSLASKLAKFVPHALGLLTVIALSLAVVALLQIKADRQIMKQMQVTDNTLKAGLDKSTTDTLANGTKIAQASSQLQVLSSKSDLKFGKYDEYITSIFPEQLKQIPQLEEKFSTTSQKLYDLAGELKTNKVDKTTFTQAQYKINLLINLAKHQDTILRQMYSASEPTNTTTDGH